MEITVPPRAIPAGAYRATLLKVNEVPNQFKPGETQLMFLFQVIDGPHPKFQIPLFCSQTYTDRSKLPRFLPAIIGRKYTEGETLNLSEAVGVEFNINLSVSPKSGRNVIESLIRN